MSYDLPGADPEIDVAAEADGPSTLAALSEGVAQARVAEEGAEAQEASPQHSDVNAASVEIICVELKESAGSPEEGGGRVMGIARGLAAKARKAYSMHQTLSKLDTLVPLSQQLALVFMVSMRGRTARGLGAGR
jgi:hypothetical protein